MGELLAMIIIPPLIGVVIFAALHFLWKRRDAAERIERRQQIELK